MRILNSDRTLKEVRTHNVTISPFRGHETKRHCALCGAPLHRWKGKSGMQPEGKALCKYCSAKANGLLKSLMKS